MLSKLLFLLVPFFIVTDPVPKTTSAEQLNKPLLLKLVNTVRAAGCQCGDTYYPAAPALSWNELLEKAALNHSNDMSKKNYFSHSSPDGRRAGERITQQGYKWTAYGENIGMGYRNEAEVVAGWISSPPHCKNIMNKSYSEMGIGRSGVYWTQVFGAR